MVSAFRAHRLPKLLMRGKTTVKKWSSTQVKVRDKRAVYRKQLILFVYLFAIAFERALPPSQRLSSFKRAPRCIESARHAIACRSLGLRSSLTYTNHRPVNRRVMKPGRGRKRVRESERERERIVLPFLSLAQV